jgi:hypothetical protein
MEDSPASNTPSLEERPAEPRSDGVVIGILIAVLLALAVYFVTRWASAP